MVYPALLPLMRTPRLYFSWNVMAHGDARLGKWRGNCRMQWVASTFHTTSEHGVSSITTADAHTSAAGSRLNWRPRRFKWTGPFSRKMKSGFCACAITFQLACTNLQGDITQITTGNCSAVVPHNLRYPRSRIPLQKLTISHLVKLPALHGIWGFIAMFTKARKPVSTQRQINPVHKLPPSCFKT
jgi:hypothetical protein